MTDSDIQQKLTRSCLEELSSRMDRESSLHAKRVDELEQQLKKMTSHMQAELSSLKERIADLEQQSKKASSQSEEMSSCLQVKPSHIKALCYNVDDVHVSISVWPFFNFIRYVCCVSDCKPECILHHLSPLVYHTTTLRFR